MYSMHNEGKSVVAERFIRTLKTKIYKYVSSISKNMYIDKLDDIVNEYNNTYHRAINMKPVDVKNNTYIDSSKKVDDKDHKFKVGDSSNVNESIRAVLFFERKDFTCTKSTKSTKSIKSTKRKQATFLLLDVFYAHKKHKKHKKHKTSNKQFSSS